MKIWEIDVLLENNMPLVRTDAILKKIYYQMVVEAANSALAFKTADLPDSVLKIFENLRDELSRRYKITLPVLMQVSKLN